jgi:hypothetical protein
LNGVGFAEIRAIRALIPGDTATMVRAAVKSQSRGRQKKACE